METIICGVGQRDVTSIGKQTRWSLSLSSLPPADSLSWNISPPRSSGMLQSNNQRWRTTFRISPFRYFTLDITMDTAIPRFWCCSKSSQFSESTKERRGLTVTRWLNTLLGTYKFPFEIRDNDDRLISW